MRNNFFRGGIILAALSLIIIIVSATFVLKAYPGTTASAAMRSQGLAQKLVEGFANPSAYVPFWTMLGAVVYSLIGITLIYFFFEKTQSPEILFFGLFVISLSFEFERLNIPLMQVFSFPPMYLIAAARILLFGRYFGLFALFATGIFASGLDVQKQQTVFFMLILAALVIAFNVPIDSLVWDSSLKVLNGYGSMFTVVEGGILAVTVLTFLVSAFTRGSRHYVIIGLGALMTYVGRNILLKSDTWITPIPGMILLLGGTWLVCALLHREYLWL